MDKARAARDRAEKQLQKPQPTVAQRLRISESDHLPPGADQEPLEVAIDRSAVTALAKHMAANRRRPARAAEPSTAVAVRATTEKESAQALSKKAKKAVKTGTKVRKDLVRKPKKVDRPTTERLVTYV